MADAVEVVKKAAVEAVKAGKPVNLLFGQVISATPLKIQVDQKAIYTEKMLVLTRNVTDFEVDMMVSHITGETGGGSDAAAFETHSHPIQGRKKFKIYNAPVVGDWVLLARMQGGRKFVVLDRIKAHPDLKGEWL